MTGSDSRESQGGPRNDPNDADARAKRRRLVLFGLILAAASLFMYASFIVKTAVRGP